jgi:hypothetical protein
MPETGDILSAGVYKFNAPVWVELALIAPSAPCGAIAKWK